MDSGTLVLSVKRERLPLREECVGKMVGMGPVAGSLFAVIFFVPGFYITLIGLQIVKVDASSIHAPYWVITCMGVSFAVAGLLVLAMVLREWRLDRWRLEQNTAYPHLPALADYPWNPQGVLKSQWLQVWKAVGGSLFLLVFLSPFNWWAWLSGDGGLFIKAIVSIFDVLFVAGLGRMCWQIVLANKYGGSGLAYLNFPYHTGQTVELKWFPPQPIRCVENLTGILRCVEEWTEVHGYGKNRSKKVVHEQLWAATQTLKDFVVDPIKNYHVFSFAVPSDVPGTNMVEEPLTFWEFEVHADVAGPDFKESYLVPIYVNSEVGSH